MSNAGVFKGQCAIVTGGATGIGESTAKMLAADGAEVTIFDIDEAGCARVVKEIQAAGGRASARRVDLTDWNATRDAVTAVHDAAGRLDVIVHSAGGFPRYVNLLDCPVEDWDLVVNSNLRSMFYLLKVAGPLMMARRYGRFVTLSSMAARSGVNPNPPHYTAAKAGVLGLVLSAAATYAPRGLRVNAVAPGLVRTPLTQRITGSPAATQASQALHALGRLGEPEDVAAVMAWLLGPEATWVTGQCYGVDGGLGTVRAK